MASLTNFEIQKYYQKEPKFNGINSRNNWPKIKYGSYIVNLWWELIGLLCMLMIVM